MNRDPIVAATEAHIAREEAGAAAVERAYEDLQAELTEALQHDPARKVSTPGWRDTFSGRGGLSSAASVVIDDAHSDAGMEGFLALLRIVGEVSRSMDVPLALRLRAMAVIAGISKRHAAQHAEEASWN